MSSQPQGPTSELVEQIPDQYDEDDDVLVDYFERSASAVRHSFDRFEQEIVRPGYNYALTSFRKRPIRSTFAAFYFSLSILPVLSFIGFSVFIFATSIFVGLATAIFGAACAIGVSGFWLACALIFFFFVSFNLTLTALGTYLSVRFILRAREDGPRVAFSSLVAETGAQFARGRRMARATFHVKEDSESDVAAAASGPSDAPVSGLGEKVAG